MVETKKTSDTRALVCGEQVVAAYERHAAKGEIRANIHSGGSRKEHILNDNETRLAVNSAKAIGAEICGVDILNSEPPAVIEINLSPAVRNINEVTGKNVADIAAKFLHDRTKLFVEAKSKKGFDSIKKELDFGNKGVEIKDLITHLDIKADMIRFPAEITKITRFDRNKEVMISAKKGKLEVREA